MCIRDRTQSTWDEDRNIAVPLSSQSIGYVYNHYTGERPLNRGLKMGIVHAGSLEGEYSSQMSRATLPPRVRTPSSKMQSAVMGASPNFASIMPVTTAPHFVPRDIQSVNVVNPLAIDGALNQSGITNPGIAGGKKKTVAINGSRVLQKVPLRMHTRDLTEYSDFATNNANSNHVPGYTPLHTSGQGGSASNSDFGFVNTGKTGSSKNLRDMQPLGVYGGGYMPAICLLYTSPSPRDGLLSRMPSSA
eukprot:TRINITY_DN5342_c0_g2_i4.p2 TRINITY_DN5342_c0_g2~~TRINITY_DN5342_c0_g2_i4.p2  ORF type:complete len:247 (-),score=27.03 TRINITY_DN5342_c0_g2_i4:54-794(-)